MYLYVQSEEFFNNEKCIANRECIFSKCHSIDDNFMNYFKMHHISYHSNNNIENNNFLLLNLYYY